VSLLEVRDVSKAFGGLQALRQVSFAVGAGEIVGIMGANGAGKTTLFSLLAGHERPSAGSIEFAGRRIDGLSPDRICRIGMARTFQIVRPFRGLSVLENVVAAVLFGRSGIRGQAAAEARAQQVLSEVGLEGEADKAAGSLTLSDQKRLEVAKTVATEPRILLLDEVMAGLTPTEVRAMIETIRRLREAHGFTVLVIEHVMRALMDLSQRIIVLHHGELIAEGGPEEIADHPRVLEAYLGANSVAGG
jgi:branched-chain amino acid transport system ATP-binding protein